MTPVCIVSCCRGCCSSVCCSFCGSMCLAMRDCNRDAGEPLGRGPSAPKVFIVKCVFCEVGSTVLFSD